MRRLFVLFLPFATLATCASEHSLRLQKATEKAASISLESYCPEFGVIEQSINEWCGEDGKCHLTLKNKDGKILSLPPGQAKHALEIATEAELNDYLTNYKNLCGLDKPPFYSDIVFVRNQRLSELRPGVIGGLKEGEYFDFSKLDRPEYRVNLGQTIFKAEDPLLVLALRFRLAWLNEKENQNIYNREEYRGDEFKFHEDQTSFAQIRRISYVFTDRFELGEYDFAKSCLRLAEKDVSGLFSSTKPDMRAVVPVIGFENRGRLPESNIISEGFIDQVSPLELGDYKVKFRRSECIPVPQGTAKFLKDQRSKSRSFLLLFRLQPKIIQPYTCPDLAGVPFRDYEQVETCKKEKWNLRKVKIFEVELVRYAIEVNGQVFKNF